MNVDEQKHIVKSYDEDLNQITRLILKMGDEVINAIDITFEAIKSCDENLIETINNIDNIINDLDSEIDQYAITVIALRQPVAIDLRFLVTATKIATILERMGDLAKNIVKRITEDDNKINPKFISYFGQLVPAVKDMISDVLQAFAYKDESKAISVRKKDRVINNIYLEFLQEIQQFMIENPQEIPYNLRVLFAAKNFERIGDHTAKLAKHVLYIVLGSYPDKNIG